MPSASSEVSTRADPGFARRFNEALKLRSAKRYSEAKEILLTLADENAKSASVFGILGDVYWHLNSLGDAIECFRRATELSPTSELASLGLFHTLWESEQTKPALNEMVRFLTGSHSPEYAKLLPELIPLSRSSRRPRPARRVASEKASARKPASKGRNAAKKASG